MAAQAQPLSRYRPGQQPGLVNPSVLAANTAPAGDPIYGTPGGTTAGLSGQYGTAAPGTSLPGYNTDPNTDIHNSFYQAQGLETGMNEGIYNEGTSQLGYYSPIQQKYQGAQDQALQELQQTPGYTSEEQAAIAGDPGAAKAITQAGIGKEQAQLDEYGQNLSGQVGNYASYTGSGLDTLKSGLQGAQSGFSKLDTAVNNPALAFDPNATEKQLTDADVQEMKTAAGTRVGNQYRSAEDQLRRDAAAAGNSSPLAIAAANARLQTQSAAGMGDAEVNADIAARQAQQERAAQIEQQREGATQTQAGMKAQAATTEQGQAQNAAALAGTQAIQAGEAVGQAGINAANQYGQTAINQQNTQTGQGSQAAITADTQASQRAQDAAQTRISGQGAYRSGVAQQQGLSQQGGQTAVSQQQGAASTLGNQLNQSTAARAGYETSGQGNSALNQAAKVVGSIFKEGGIVTEPTEGVIGEAGPELVMPLPRYRRNERMAA
jgi:hypothetical protein